MLFSIQYKHHGDIPIQRDKEAKRLSKLHFALFVDSPLSGRTLQRFILGPLYKWRMAPHVIAPRKYPVYKLKFWRSKFVRNRKCNCSCPGTSPKSADSCPYSWPLEQTHHRTYRWRHQNVRGHRFAVIPVTPRDMFQFVLSKWLPILHDFLDKS